MPKRSFKVVEDDIAFLEKIRRENSLFSVDEAHSFVFEQLRKGKTAFEENIPEKCKSCPKCGFIIKNGKLLCITKKTETDPIRGDWIPLEVVGVCSEKPFNTPINRKTREQFERDLSNMEKMKIYHQNRADKLINEKHTLTSGVSDLQNTFLENKRQISALETDNEQLRKIVEELSHDTLVETYKDVTHQLEEAKQLLKVQQAQSDNKINEYNIEIQKLEALIDKKNQILNDVLSQASKFLRDAKQFAPHSPQSYDQDFIQFSIALRKSIVNFEGYLNTIAS